MKWRFIYWNFNQIWVFFFFKFYLPFSSIGWGFDVSHVKSLSWIFQLKSGCTSCEGRSTMFIQVNNSIDRLIDQSRRFISIPAVDEFVMITNDMLRSCCGTLTNNCSFVRTDGGNVTFLFIYYYHFFLLLELACESQTTGMRECE